MNNIKKYLILLICVGFLGGTGLRAQEQAPVELNFIEQLPDELLAPTTKNSRTQEPSIGNNLSIQDFAHLACASSRLHSIFGASSENMDYADSVARWLYNNTSPIRYIALHAQSLTHLTLNETVVPVDIERIITYLVNNSLLDPYELSSAVESDNQQLKDFAVSALKLDGYNSLVAIWLDRNFSNPINYLQRNSNSLEDIYGVKIANPEKIIALINQKPYNTYMDLSNKYLDNSVEYWKNLISSKPNLRSLNLSWNDNLLRMAPACWQQISNLPNLIYLDLNKSYLSNLHFACWQQIAKMPNLRSLNLSNNHLCSLPLDCWQQIAKLKKLHSLNLSGNNLKKLIPKRWQEIKNMTHLRALDLGGNDLHELSLECWNVIASMTHLRSLYLSGNDLHKLSLEHWKIIANMTHLRSLDLSGNDLHMLPPEYWQVIASMTYLRSLYLKFNTLYFGANTNNKFSMIIGDMRQRGVIIILK